MKELDRAAKQMEEVLKQSEGLFKQMDEIFKQMEKRVEEAMVQQGPVEREPWKEWFAWRPVKVNGKTKWMQNVFRRPLPKDYSNYDDWTKYEYGTVFDAIRDSGKDH